LPPRRDPASAARDECAAPLPSSADRDDARLVLRCLRHAGKLLSIPFSTQEAQQTESRPGIFWRRWGHGRPPARPEAEILAWVALGKTDAEVAAILAISPRTVSHTLERVYRKLGVESRLAASMRALGVLRAGRRTLSA